jgi:hypothetical protein
MIDLPALAGKRPIADTRSDLPDRIQCAWNFLREITTKTDASQLRRHLPPRATTRVRVADSRNT